MNIPDYQQLMLPILQRLADQGGELAIDALSDMVASAMAMSDVQRNRRLPSGQETVFGGRMRWALSYLESTGAVTAAANGMIRLSDAGSEQLADQLPGVEALPAATGRLAPPQSGHSGQSGQSGEDHGDEAEGRMQEFFQICYKRLKEQLLQRIHGQSPAFFENLVIDLLLAMGYGGRRPDLARSLGRSGDGGVDGVVRRDSLGLDVVYVQAKRYRPGTAVAISAVRDFAGALDAHKADKGVMVTTSHFPASAVKFAQASRRRIAFIDGDRLTNLLIRHNIAVRPHMTFEMKHLDEDYFDGMRDNVEARHA